MRLTRVAALSVRHQQCRTPAIGPRHIHFSFNKDTPNRIFTPIRTESEFDTISLLCASARMPLITYWTATWCASCKVIRPVLKELLEDEQIGAKNGGIGFAEVEMDAPTVSELASRYMIRSTPTILPFNRQEPQRDRAVVDVRLMKQKDWLMEWLVNEAKRRN